MIYTFFTLIFSSLLFQTQDKAEILNNIVDQSDYFITEIAKGNNVEKNYWGLVENVYSSEFVDSVIQIRIQDLKTDNAYLRLIADNKHLKGLEKRSTLLREAFVENNSLLIGIAYLVTQSGFDDQSFTQAINRSNLLKSSKDLLIKVKNGEKLQFSDIDLTHNPFAHYLLLFTESRVSGPGSRRVSYFSDDYLQKIVDEWDSRNLDRYKQTAYLKASYDLFKYGNILSSYSSVIENQHLPYSQKRIRLLRIIDYSLLQNGRFDLANQIIQEQTLPLFELFGNEETKNRALEAYGLNLYRLGKFEESRDLYIHLVEDLNFINANTLNNLSINYYQLGQFDKYLSIQTRSIDAAKEAKDYRELLRIYSNLHLYHRYNKNWNTALSYLEESKNLATLHADDFEDDVAGILANTYMSFGEFYWDYQKDFDKAIENLNEGLSSINEEDNYNIYVEILIKKSRILFHNGKRQESVSILNKVSELSFSKSDIALYLEAQTILAMIYLQQNDIRKVSEIITSLDKYDTSILDFEDFVELKNLHANYIFKKDKNDIKDAYNIIDPVIKQVIERSKNNTNFQSGYWNIEDAYLNAFETIISLNTESGKKTSVIELLDQLKTINDANFYSNPLISGNKLSGEELIQEKILSQQLQSLRKQLLIASNTEKTNLQAQIDQKTAERELLLAKVDSKAQEKSTPMWMLQRRLGYDQVMVHITEINDFFYKATITRHDIEIEKLPFGEEERALYERTSIALAEKETDLNDLYAIYKHLNLETLPKSKSQVLLVPDSYLYRIPIDILPTRVPNSSTSYGSARYLLEDKLVTMYSSIQEFFHNSRKRNAKFDVAFNAYGISNFDNITSKELVSLPGAMKEVNILENNLPYFDSKKIFKENQATKEMFKTTIGSSRVVHVATHSEVSEQDPLYSTIYLNSNGSDSTDDGTLYAYELYNLNINSDLIVLNSCSSGSGDYLQGTGVLGITRALRYAGARSLVLNLWSVNDNVASRFAQDFYNELGKGLTKPEALRNAKLKQIETGSADPHYWGVYMFIGNPSQLTEKSSSSAGMYSFLGLILALTIYLGYTQTQPRYRRKDKEAA